MQTQPQTKPQIQTQKGTKNMQQYLAELDALLKKNTGTGLYSAEDTSSNTPMYLPGKVANPGGVESNASAISSEPRESVIPDFQMPVAPQQEEQPQYQEEQSQDPQGEAQGAAPMSVQDFVQQFTKAVYSPQRASTEQLDQSYKQTGQKYGVQSMADGRVRYNDGSIGIEEEKDPNAIASMRDGSVLWDDGFTREAPPQGMQSQLSGTQGLSKYIFGRNQTVTQPYGNVNPIEPTPGNVNYGTDFRTRDLDVREQTIPGEVKILQIYRDDGTRFGTTSGHKGYGNSILIETPSGQRVRLSHLSNLPDYQEGQVLSDGQFKITPGSTGNTYGEHLDVEVYDEQGNISSPEKFLANVGSNYSSNSKITGVSPYLQRENMSVDPRSLANRETSTTQTEPQQSTGTQQFASYSQPNTSIQSQRPSASSGQGMYNPGQALSKFGQEVKQVPKKLAGAIDSANPTGEFDLGGTEGIITPEAAQTRMDTAVKFAQPAENRNFLGKFRQTVGNAAEQVGNMAGIPETGISEILAGGKTRQTNQAFASELDQSAKQNEPVSQSLNLKQGAEDVVKQAGQGIKDLGQSGVDALGAVFRPKLQETKRAVGDVAGTADPTGKGKFSSLMDGAPSMSTMAKNDTSDPFFKMGGAEMYKNFLQPNAKDNFGGALNMDMFTPDFYKDLGNISSVFGGSKDLAPATEKYVTNEQSKYPAMSRANPEGLMSYEEGYDRGEIDAYNESINKETSNYNKQVDEYNNSINKYLNDIRSSVTGAKSIFTPTQSYSKNIFAKPQAAVRSTSMSPAPQMSMAKPQMSMARPAVPQMSVAPAPVPQMSIAPRASAPAQSFSSSPAQNSSPAAANMTSAATGRPAVAPKPAPRAAPAPAKLAPMSYAKPMSVAPKSAPQQSKAPAPQSKPSSNVFSRVTNAIKNVFRR